VRLVGPGGEQVGIVKLDVALRLAGEADLDLVEVAPDARPPVAKLMDYGKFKYESAQKARDARRHQANTVLKEIRFRLKIDPHDYGTKKGHVERFLGQGDKVKVMIMFRGREQSRPELGMRLLQKLADEVSELATVESAPRQDGRNMVMVLAPVKKKAARLPARKRTRDAAPARASQQPPAGPVPAAPPPPARPPSADAAAASADAAPPAGAASADAAAPAPAPAPPVATGQVAPPPANPAPPRSSAKPAPRAAPKPAPSAFGAPARPGAPSGAAAAATGRPRPQPAKPRTGKQRPTHQGRPRSAEEPTKES
jgi:translation initiation factor IF-3